MKSRTLIIACVAVLSCIVVSGTFSVHAQTQAQTGVGSVDLGKTNGVGSVDSGSSNGVGSNDKGTGNQGTFTLTNPLEVDSIGALVQSLVEIFSYVVILFAVLALIYTGFQYILAQGNATKIKELHVRLLYIVIGIAVVIGARVIVDVVINTISASGTVSQQVIQSARNANSGN